MYTLQKISQSKSVKKIKRTRAFTPGGWCASPNPDYSFYRDPVSFINNLAPVGRKILGFFLWKNTQHKRLFYAQATIGQYLNVARETVNRNLRPLEEAGLVNSKYRHFRCSVYAVAPILKTKPMRKLLKKLFSCFLFAFVTQMFSNLNSFALAKEHMVIDSLSTQRHATQNEPNVNFHNKKGYCKATYLGEYRLRIDERLKMERSYDKKKTIEAIESLRDLVPFTQAGKYFLSVYSHSAILEAIKAFKTHKGEVRDPFRFIRSICIRVTNRDKLEYNRSLLAAALAKGIIKKSDQPLMRINKPEPVNSTQKETTPFMYIPSNDPEFDDQHQDAYQKAEADHRESNKFFKKYDRAADPTAGSGHQSRNPYKTPPVLPYEKLFEIRANLKKQYDDTKAGIVPAESCLGQEASLTFLARNIEYYQKQIQKHYQHLEQ